MKENAWKKAVEFGLDLLYPHPCPFCGALTKGEAACAACLQGLPRMEEEACVYCGRGKVQCACRQVLHNYSGVAAALYYAKAVPKALGRYKRECQKKHNVLFGSFVADAVRKRYKNIVFDCCTSVPSGKKALRERGFDHTALLAKVVGKTLELPYFPMLKKCKENKPQKELSAEERRGNVLGAFQMLPQEVRGKIILLVDDLKTTGATVDECSKILLLAGAEAVYVAVLAVTEGEEEPSAPEDAPS